VWSPIAGWGADAFSAKFVEKGMMDVATCSRFLPGWHAIAGQGDRGRIEEPVAAASRRSLQAPGRHGRGPVDAGGDPRAERCAHPTEGAPPIRERPALAIPEPPPGLPQRVPVLPER